MGLVVRWISRTITWPRFWSLRQEWPDLAQEALGKAIESLREGRYDDRRDFSLYVQGVARLTALRALRKSRRHSTEGNSVSVERLAAGPDHSPHERLARREILRKVMDLASEECRHLMRAYYLRESSYEEIATSLGTPIGSVKSRLFRCLEAARRSIRVMVWRRENDDA